MLLTSHLLHLRNGLSRGLTALWILSSFVGFQAHAETPLAYSCSHDQVPLDPPRLQVALHYPANFSDAQLVPVTNAPFLLEMDSLPDATANIYLQVTGYDAAGTAHEATDALRFRPG